METKLSECQERLRGDDKKETSDIERLSEIAKKRGGGLKIVSNDPDKVFIIFETPEVGYIRTGASIEEALSNLLELVKLS